MIAPDFHYHKVQVCPYFKVQTQAVKNYKNKMGSEEYFYPDSSPFQQSKA